MGVKVSKPKYSTTKEYLTHYNKKYTFHTRYKNIKQRHKWLKFQSKEYKAFYEDQNIEAPHHREILPNEVVIDIDTTNKEILSETIKEITRRLQESKINYSLWHTGGKGVHYHTYWKNLDKHTTEDRKTIKELIIKHLCYGLITKARIDMQLCSTHMIRAEHGEHEATHFYKEFLEANNELEPNTIPKGVLNKHTEILEQRRQWKPATKTVNGTTPNCVRFFLSDDFVACKDGRKNAMFALASWFKQQGKTDKETYELLTTWSHYKLHDYIKPGNIAATIQSSKGTMGCRGRHSILKMIGKLDVIKGCAVCEEQERRK